MLPAAAPNGEPKAPFHFEGGQIRVFQENPVNDHGVQNAQENEEAGDKHIVQQSARLNAYLIDAVKVIPYFDKNYSNAKKIMPTKKKTTDNIPNRFQQSIRDFIPTTNEIVPVVFVKTRAAYREDVSQKPYVVIQHDSSAKELFTNLFRNTEHTLIETDLNYTGLFWRDKSVTNLFDIVNHQYVQFIFLPFVLKRWHSRIDSSVIASESLYRNAVYEQKYFDAIKSKFQDKQLFGHLNYKCMRVGVRVHCFLGEVCPQSNKIKDDICWVLQYESLQKNYYWQVVNHSSDENCDITLVVTISQRCFMTGIQIRKPQLRIPDYKLTDGISLMWPFLHACEYFRVRNATKNGRTIQICLLVLKNNIAAFELVRKRKSRNGGTSVIYWKPSNLPQDRVKLLWNRVTLPVLNKTKFEKLLFVQQYLHRSETIKSMYPADVTVTSDWVV
ncbi:hypothetical protein GCK72_024895 [Caenorhabditis remanei]|uniref:Uncharacterized protein n=1 Tax=Caenorhabditis remanei TaxID=31234 RepID=A0A6A5G0H2_CAERE|nr:hypothetical protein GCK72_024895 [Caenorhabditis remanei]KAF1748428.1 hypothetical protein GCK72_024895 [Caenorhabditis remanei]